MDYSLAAPDLARHLLGCLLVVRNENSEVVGGIIRETEAYTSKDPASHSFKGPTLRNRSMFLQPSTVYMFRLYGKHICFNIVCGNKDGQAVLIRSLIPTMGIEQMKFRRNTQIVSRLTNGPAGLVQALGLNMTYDGKSLKECAIAITPYVKNKEFVITRRIGISKATDTPWRFLLKDVE